MSADKSLSARLPRLAATSGVLLAVALAGTVALAGCEATGPRVGRPVPDATTPTAPPFASPTDPSPGRGGTGGQPSVRVADADCRAVDLDPRPWYTGDGAAGSVYSGVVVQSRATKPCRLPGIPTVLVTDAAGATGPFPAATACCADSGVVLVPGGYAGFAIQAGNNPDGPRCASGGFALAFDDGSRYPLAGFGVNGSCRSPAIHGWHPVSDPTSAGPQVTRAPA
jgi:hypothetical protein